MGTTPSRCDTAALSNVSELRLSEGINGVFGFWGLQLFNLLAQPHRNVTQKSCFVHPSHRDVFIFSFKKSDTQNGRKEEEGEGRKGGRGKAEEREGTGTQTWREQLRTLFNNKKKNKKRETPTLQSSSFYLTLLLNGATNRFFFHFYFNYLERMKGKRLPEPSLRACPHETWIWKL